jgi:hypothetical protein
MMTTMKHRKTIAQFHAEGPLHQGAELVLDRQQPGPKQAINHTAGPVLKSSPTIPASPTILALTPNR